MRSRDGGGDWICNVLPHGTGGYAYVLQGNELVMKIGHWVEPHQRPSAMIELRSEFLWTAGPEAAVERAVELIRVAGGQVQTVKPSRVDLCVDVLVPDSVWSMDLMPLFVTRASDMDPHLKYKELTGFSIGKGQISARLYDKPLEIAAKSHKI